ncbi:hypothetical protein GMMP15_1130005 [Candidatus Magnetomoraceae bacterium gMMP-15]
MKLKIILNLMKIQLSILAIILLISNNLNAQELDFISYNYSPLEQIKSSVLDAPKQQDITSFIKELDASSLKVRKQWEKEYLELITSWQINSQIRQLQQFINGIESNIKDTKDIFSHKIKSVHIPYLVLARAEVPAHRNGKKILVQLVEFSKKFIATQAGPKLITSYRAVKYGRLEKDLVQSISGGKVEASAASPLIKTRGNMLYVLQKYHLYPDISSKKEGDRNENASFPDPIIIENLSDFPDLYPASQNKKASLIDDLQKEKYLSDSRFSELCQEYENMIKPLYKMRNKFIHEKRELSNRLKSFSKNHKFQSVNFESSNIASKLEQHLKYERVFYRVEKSFFDITMNRSENQFYQDIAENTFKLLQNDAKSFKGLNISRVRNGILVDQWEGTKRIIPKVISFAIPARIYRIYNNTFNPDEQEFKELGVIMAIRVVFEEESYLTKLDNKKSGIKVLPAFSSKKTASASGYGYYKSNQPDSDKTAAIIMAMARLLKDEYGKKKLQIKRQDYPNSLFGSFFIEVKRQITLTSYENITAMVYRSLWDSESCIKITEGSIMNSTIRNYSKFLQELEQIFYKAPTYNRAGGDGVQAKIKIRLP